MQKGKVNIAQGYPETLSNLKIFMENQKIVHSDKKLKTLADAIDFAIQEAEKVPKLEKKISELEAENSTLKKRVEELEFKLDAEYLRQDECVFGDDN